MSNFFGFTGHVRDKLGMHGPVYDMKGHVWPEGRALPRPAGDAVQLCNCTQR